MPRDRLRTVDPEEAVAHVRPGDVVLWAVALEPLSLADAFVAQRERLRGTVMLHDIARLAFPWFEEGFGDYFRVYDLFPGANSRQAVARGTVEFVPLPFGLIDSERAANPDRRNLYARPDVYLTRMTPPDADGFVSFGVFPWFWRDAISAARLVIGELDPGLPRTTAKVHISEIDLAVPAPAHGTPYPRRPLPPTPPEELDAAQVVGAYAAELIQDGDTFQIGVSPAAESMVQYLRDRHDLGVHSELIFPGIVELVREGVVTGSRKNVDRGKVVTAGLFTHPDDPEGPGAIEFVERHPELFEFRTVSQVANVKTVAQIDNFVAVNGILAIDLTGQAVIETLGYTPIAGIGGIFDFTVGSHYSRGGRAVYCLVSTAKGGTVSRIVPRVPHDPYNVVSMPRYMVDYVVTEWGVANLEGKSLRERAEALIGIAHPHFRAELREAACKLGLL